MEEINMFLWSIVLLIIQVGFILIVLAAVGLVLVKIYFEFDENANSHYRKI